MKFFKGKTGVFRRETMGIRRKLILLICLSVFFVASVGIGLGYYGAINILRDHAIENQANIAVLISNFLRHSLQEEANLFKGYATTDIIKQAIRDSNARFDAYQISELERFQSQMDEDWIKSLPESPLVARYTQNTAARRLQELLAVDKSIVELLITDKYGNLVIASNKTTDFYQADEAWWQEAFKGKTGDVFVGEYAYDASARLWSVDFVTLIRDGNGEVMGVAKAVVSASVFFGPLKDFKVGRTGHAFLVGQSGGIIFHEGVHKAYREFITPRLLQQFLAAKGHSGYLYSPIEKKKFFVSGAVVASTPFIKQADTWIVLMSRDVSEIFSDFNRLILQGVSLLVFLILLLIPIGFIFGGRFVKPLEELARASDHVAKGDLDYTFNIKTGDEIEGLSKAFAAMVIKIKQSQKEILFEKAYLDNIISSMSDALFIFDLKGRIIDVNRESLELLGYERQELIGQPMSIFLGQQSSFQKIWKAKDWAGTVL